MRLSVLGALVALAASTALPGKTSLFENFIAKYNKVYATEFEKGQRFQIFSENIDEIYASNAKNRSYTLGVSKNTDLTFEEWRASHLTGFKPVLAAEGKTRPVFRAPTSFVEAESVDWVTKGGVTSVKNQGTCGSCWAFSTVGALEGAMASSGRKMVDLSMQQILACDTGGNACNGGSMIQAFEWVKENGLASLKDDPYLCKDGSSSECKNMKCDTKACSKRTGETCLSSSFFYSCLKVEDSMCYKSGHCECGPGQCFKDGKCVNSKPTPLVLNVGDVASKTNVDQSENALEAAVAQQPVSVAIEADKSAFQHYMSGVLTSDACGSNLDHGVLAVGYGTDNGQKYWKVKNSWGTSFGEDGYIRIEKGKATPGGECGIRKMATFPTLKASASDIVV